MRTSGRLVGMLLIAVAGWSADIWVENERHDLVGEAALIFVYPDGAYERTETRQSGFVKVRFAKPGIVTLLMTARFDR